MANLLINIVYVLILAAFIIFIDFKYFRYKFMQRLIVNIAIAVVFVIVYYLFFVSL